mgnify:FL=1
MLLDYFDDLERNTCLRINALSRHAFVRDVFGSVSRLGDYPAWVIFGVICAAYPGTDAGVVVLQAALTGLVGVLVYKLLKERLVRERPFIRHGDIVCAAAPLDRYSFPSGHTLHAVSFSMVYASQVPQLAWILAPFALLVALSRVILGLHYPTDVVAGAAIGAGLATASIAMTANLA